MAKIFSQVAAKNPSAKLVMIGRDSFDLQTGLSTWELFQQYIDAQVMYRIEYVGSKLHDEIINFIHQAAICVFPSYAEALPLSWLEAMCCAKPVVASNIGWAKEIVENGESGILIHPSEHVAYANVILDLLDNAENRKRIGQNARERVEKLFSIHRMANLSLTWYRDVLEKRV